jgi:hypothetical protein
MYMPLEGALAVAEGMCGNIALAEEIFEGIETRMHSEEEASAIALAYEYRTRLARKLGDREKLLSSLAALSELAQSSRDPVLIAHVDRIAALSTRMTIGSDRPLTQEAPDRSCEDTVVRGHVDRTLVTRVLDQCRVGDERADQALRLVAQCAGALRGYLLSDRGGSAQVIAQLDSEAPPEELERKMAELLAQGRGGMQGRLTVRADGSDGLERTFVVVVLGGEPVTAGTGVIALEETEDELLKLRPALIDQVGRSLIAQA